MKSGEWTHRFTASRRWGYFYGRKNAKRVKQFVIRVEGEIKRKDMVDIWSYQRRSWCFTITEGALDRSRLEQEKKKVNKHSGARGIFTRLP